MVVIGAGVVGAAVAQRLASQHSLFVLEAFDRVAEGVTSRNSGVIHSGLYYPPKSLKAQLCIRGKTLLYDWVRKKEVPHLQTGKVIVATHTEEEIELESIFRNAMESGASGLERWTGEKLRLRLPGLRGTMALFASETGVVDPVAFTKSLLNDAESQGAMVLTRAKVLKIRKENLGYVLETTRGEIFSKNVVNAAGLHSDEVAKLAGVDTYKIYPCRGDYFRFKSPEKFDMLIYPVKAKGAPGLGVHLTLDVDGGMRLGPDAEYVNSKEDFSSREDKKERFRKSAEKLFGPIRDDQLEYDQCGIRPKLRAPHETEEKDFVVSQDLFGFINLVGIESPGLTASMAIAEFVEKILFVAGGKHDHTKSD